MFAMYRRPSSLRISKNMTEETRIAIPELPFRKMRGMRNIVAHDYANVDVTVIWDVATIHAPQLIAVLEPFLAGFDSLPPQG